MDTILNGASFADESPDLTSTLTGPLGQGQGHQGHGHQLADRTISLLTVCDQEGLGLALLKAELERTEGSVLGSRVEQLVVRLNFQRWDCDRARVWVEVY